MAVQVRISVRTEGLDDGCSQREIRHEVPAKRREQAVQEPACNALANTPGDNVTLSELPGKDAPVLEKGAK